AACAQLTLIVVDQLLTQRPPEALDHASMDLRNYLGSVQGSPDVVDGHVTFNPHGARQRVDPHSRQLDAEHGSRSPRRRPTYCVKRATSLTALGVSGEVRDRHRSEWSPLDPALAVRDFEVAGIALEVAACQLEDLTARLEHGLHHRRANAIRGRAASCD